MKVLIIGGTRFVGRHLVEAALARHAHRLVHTSSNTLMVGVKYENYLAMLQAAREN